MLRISRKVWRFLPALMLVIAISFVLGGCSSGEPSAPADTGTPAVTSTTETAPTSTIPATTEPVATSTPTQTPTPTPTLTPAPTPTPAASEIMYWTKDAWSELISYQYDIDMALKMEITSAGETTNIDMTMTGTSLNNVTLGEMKMEGEMVMGTTGQGTINVPLVMYQMNGWQYTKMSIPMSGEQWIKNKIDLESYDALDDIQHAFDMGKTSSQVTLSGTDIVDGADCYILKIDPDPAELSKWLESVQKAANAGGSQEANIDYSKCLKNLSFEEWITGDGYLLKQIRILATLTLTGADTGGTAEDGDALNMDITETLVVTAYNQPVSIVLPPESQNAQDMTNQ